MTTIKSINSTQTRKFQFKLKIQIIQIVKRLKTLHFTIKCKNSTSKHCVILSFETQLSNIHIDYDIKIESTCHKTRLTQHFRSKKNSNPDFLNKFATNPLDLTFKPPRFQIQNQSKPEKPTKVTIFHTQLNPKKSNSNMKIFNNTLTNNN